MKYVVKPVLKIGENEILEIEDFSITIINKSKNRCIEKELQPEETLIIMLYWIDRISKIIIELLHKKEKEIDRITKEIINKWKKASEPTECVSITNCEYQLTIIKEKLEELYKEKDMLNTEYKELREVKEKLNKVSKTLNEILNILNIEVEQDFVLI